MDETKGKELDRRSFLRKTVASGAALAWTAPVIKTLSPTAAFAQDLSPKDLSYVAFCYTCDGVNECCVKFDLRDDGTPMACEVDSFQTSGCPFTLSGDRCGDCSLFTVGPTLIQATTSFVQFTPDAPASCHFLNGQGVGKCGNPPQTGGCVTGEILDAGRTLKFSMCGV